ncbi:uncharacterized protein [Nicotiana sylvestris]|uniref:uncharacterized protein n=1 Tax=Nicotiana sylvestris TaxID=4096 RepID=UPI00388CD1C4
MRVAAENPSRSRKDENLIYSLAQNVCDYEDYLQKTEAELANARAKLAKNAEGRASFIWQLKEKQVVSLFGILATHPYNTRSKNKLIMAGQELDASVIDPSREGEESEVNLKEELHKLKHQMAEMYQAWTQDNQYYPPEPNFKAPDHYSYTPYFDLPVDTEKPPKNLEQEEMFRKVRSLEQSFRNMQGLGGQILRQLDVLRPIESKLPNPPPKNIDYSLSCSYCSGTPWHDTKKCWHLKNAIQELIDTKQIVLQTPEAPNINQNPLPTHDETNMIEIVHKEGEPKKPSQSVMMIWSSEVKPVKKPTVEGSVNKLSMTNGEPFVVVEKRSPSDAVAKQEKSKVIVPGLASKPIIIVEGARTDPVIIKPVTQLLVVNTKAIPWSYERVIVTYKGKEVNE